MSRIVDAYGNARLGYPKINLDHVATFKPRPGIPGKSIAAYECFTADGERLGEVGAYDVDREERHAIVPETSGTTAVSCYLDGEQVRTERLPVIAWDVCVLNHEPLVHPICCEALGEVWFLEIWDPRANAISNWVSPGVCSFDTLEAALLWARERLQPKQAATA